MSNDLTSTPGLWVLDERGILSETPVYISQIVYIPNAAEDDLTFKQWDKNTVVAAGGKEGKTGTITSAKTLTSNGNIPSTVAAGHIFEILYSSGTSDNTGKRLVEVAGDNNAVTITEDNWTNEASKIYSWRTFATSIAFVLKAGTGDDSPINFVFYPRGRRFPNLALDVIDGGTVYVYLRQT